ncbi:hypothetical protein Pmar_PMAR018386 [Perkinsus marinus ATCC 50983]|uniref:Uncharacterized protein n=1 Tax=Perkinsus marinus (strain ATCC 50983 / TXsc) TaxID=423536 RepID=C5LS30_PERM5|nr:hypothetical protein Pmar_PMAR018386 [Perkinsus marinus ATCC 50983]EER00502.1 hypothetical protein Pmar_PMAR018386 [Perkinsus marinus ATCC 50983]|eukprot:XP_002767784.1 hypothetical protein Pmar_PMAR018386 [Perkinsus marinus ATCC 50983]
MSDTQPSPQRLLVRLLTELRQDIVESIDRAISTVNNRPAYGTMGHRVPVLAHAIVASPPLPQRALAKAATTNSPSRKNFLKIAEVQAQGGQAVM